MGTILQKQVLNIHCIYRENKVGPPTKPVTAQSGCGRCFPGEMSHLKLINSMCVKPDTLTECTHHGRTFQWWRPISTQKHDIIVIFFIFYHLTSSKHATWSAPAYRNQSGAIKQPQPSHPKLLTEFRRCEILPMTERLGGAQLERNYGMSFWAPISILQYLNLKTVYLK